MSQCIWLWSLLPNGYLFWQIGHFKRVWFETMNWRNETLLLKAHRWLLLVSIQLLVTLFVITHPITSLALSHVLLSRRNVKPVTLIATASPINTCFAFVLSPQLLITYLHRSSHEINHLSSGTHLLVWSKMHYDNRQASWLSMNRAASNVRCCVLSHYCKCHALSSLCNVAYRLLPTYAR